MKTNPQHYAIFAAACEKLGRPATLPIVDGLPEKHAYYMVNHYMLITILEARNNGWEPDWSDSSQWKYFPWPEVEATEERPAGFGFSFSGYGNAYSRADVGSRLCLKTSGQALEALEDLKGMYLINQLILSPEDLAAIINQEEPINNA